MKTTTMNDFNPSPAASLDRRGFLTKSLAVSAVAAVGTWTASGAPLRGTNGGVGALLRESGADPRVTLVISAETGEVFRTELIPGTVVETQDPKLGRLLRMEVMLDGFGKPETSASDQADQIVKLALVHQELHRPPVCLLTWGAGPTFKIKASVLAAATGFSLYTREGIPLRAHLLLDFVVFS